MLRLIDRAADLLGHLAAWMFFLTGAMITYEVLARYLFNAPTIWAAELSQLLLLWGSFIAMATLLRQRAHIRITLLTARLGDRGRQVCEAFALVFIAGFSAVAAWHGWFIAYDSFERGRSTGTMLNIPNWWSEMVIPFGFLVLLL
ncbi:MAG: TRAP transporter small permease, partial [Kiloniellales bacterium]|nr:TRAP transporter small permease [Kiloniellales bacterium]